MIRMTEVRLEYVWQPGCTVCEYLSPRFVKMCNDNGWEYDVWNAREHMDKVVALGIQVTPTVVVYVDGIYKGIVHGVSENRIRALF